MQSWKEEQNKHREIAGKKWNEKGFVFTDDCGNMKSIYSVTRICSGFEAKNQIRHLKLHGLRHTFASLLYSKGISLETLKEMLGHGSIKTTQIYTHKLCEHETAAANQMNEILELLTKEEKENDKNYDNPSDSR